MQFMTNYKSGDLVLVASRKNRSSVSWELYHLQIELLYLKLCNKPLVPGDVVQLPPDTRELLALHLVPGLGPRLTAALLERFGSPVGVFQASAGQLMEVPHIGSKLAGQIRQ